VGTGEGCDGEHKSPGWGGGGGGDVMEGSWRKVAC
jgi:hypothetical protein